MCGVIYQKSFAGLPVSEAILSQYAAQRNRGIRGFGFFLPDSNKLVHNPIERRIISLIKRLEVPEILFHHRTPTSTPNVRSSCHPFSTKDFFRHNYITIHNGWISNDATLKQEHEKLGIKYVSQLPDGQFNDTEALSWELGRYLSGDTKEFNVRGSFAVVSLEQTKQGKPLFTHFAKDDWMPLSYVLDEQGLSVASELEGTPCDPYVLYSFSHRTKKLHTSKLKMGKSSFLIPRRSRATDTGPKDNHVHSVNLPVYTPDLTPSKMTYDNELIRLSIECDHEPDQMINMAGKDIVALNTFIFQARRKPELENEAKLCAQRVAELGHIRKRIRAGRLPPMTVLEKFMSEDDPDRLFTLRYYT